MLLSASENNNLLPNSLNVINVTGPLAYQDWHLSSQGGLGICLLVADLWW